VLLEHGKEIMQALKNVRVRNDEPFTHCLFRGSG
jgi:hypothetical protein